MSETSNEVLHFHIFFFSLSPPVSVACLRTHLLCVYERDFPDFPNNQLSSRRLVKAPWSFCLAGSSELLWIYHNNIRVAGTHDSAGAHQQLIGDGKKNVQPRENISLINLFPTPQRSSPFFSARVFFFFFGGATPCSLYRDSRARLIPLPRELPWTTSTVNSNMREWVFFSFCLPLLLSSVFPVWRECSSLSYSVRRNFSSVFVFSSPTVVVTVDMRNLNFSLDSSLFRHRREEQQTLKPHDKNSWWAGWGNFISLHNIVETRHRWIMPLRWRKWKSSSLAHAISILSRIACYCHRMNEKRARDVFEPSTRNYSSETDKIIAPFLVSSVNQTHIENISSRVSMDRN